VTSTARPVEAAAQPRLRRLITGIGGRVRAGAARVASRGRIGGSTHVLFGPRTRALVLAPGSLSLGTGVVLRGDAQIYVQGECTFGRDVFVNRWFSLSCYEAVAIGDRVRIGERVSIHDENHDTASDVRAFLTERVTLGEAAWIGAGVTILPGSTIGAGSIVGAGSVVRGEIPPRSLAAGVPARVIRSLDGH